MLKREELQELLRRETPASCLARLAGHRRAKRLLLSFLYHDDARVLWGAVETLALWAREKTTGRDSEQVRRVVRHLLWCMNDESGSICRAAPFAIGSIVDAVPELAAEYIPMLASFIHEEPFEAGTLWALWRVGKRASTLAGQRRQEIVGLLESEDPSIRGHAVLLLQAWGVRPEETLAEALASDRATFTVYDFQTKTLSERTVGAVARDAWGVG